MNLQIKILKIIYLQKKKKKKEIINSTKNLRSWQTHVPKSIIWSIKFMFL